RGNVINPDDIVTSYGADSLRLYEMFMGPLEQQKSWSMKGVEGVNRFLNRLWRLLADEYTGQLLDTVVDSEPDEAQLRLLHQTIKKVTEDIENMRFNTAIAQMMVFVNEANKWVTRPRSLMSTFVLLVSPFAPHIAEELWHKLGNRQTLAYEPWPDFSEAYLEEDTREVVVQINGKLRYKLQLPASLSKAETEQQAMASERIQELVAGKQIVKVIVVPDKLVNIVVR
ncbi:MAG: class I tRNA ligase family protein, partial [Calditrichaeota bacterium]|nr:class I tRNA ligase family protein [Calditrichota bacterium]